MAKIPVAGYCRTSGEGQRDNTSIPRQKEDIERFCKAHGFQLIGFYVDESKSGSKVEGRDEYQRMMGDARKGHFEGVVVFKIDRLHRAKIKAQVEYLKDEIGVFTVDTAGYDNRSQHGIDKFLGNRFQEVFAEYERLQIMQRMVGGRIKKAKDGVRWAEPPRFREFVYHNPKKKSEGGYWRISERGERFRELLKRYVKGNETLRSLAKEFGFSSAEYISHAVRLGQLAASPYIATFNCPEIGIVNEQIEVTAVPPLISRELEQQVIERFEHNRCYSKPGNKNNYLLQSFVFCTQCGRAISAGMHKKHAYYVHPTNNGKPCVKSIRVDRLEPAVLDYLFRFFLDEPALEKAIDDALPSDDRREELIEQIRKIQKQQAANDKKIKHLTNAIMDGADVSLLLDTQNELKETKSRLAKQLEEIQAEHDLLPDPVLVKKQGAAIRAQLLGQYANRDWRELSKDEIQEFLFYLFGDNRKKTSRGIFIDQKDGKTIVTFNGRFQFDRIVDDRLCLISPEQMEKINKHWRKMAAMKTRLIELDSEIQELKEGDFLCPRMC